MIECYDFRQVIYNDMSVSDNVKSCVSRKMSIISHEHPEMPQKQRLAIAYSYCRSKQDFYVMAPEDYIIQTEDALPLAQTGITSTGPIGIASQSTKPMMTLYEAMKANAGLKGKAAPAPGSPGTKSSNINKIGYYNSMLEVEFHSGDRYVYFVGPEFYDQFVEAPSKGKWLWKNLRGKKPGLVFPAGPKMTPGGVGGSIVPYSKGSGGTPESETMEAKPTAQIPSEAERNLAQKELEILFRSKGLRFPQFEQARPKSDFTMEGFITRSGGFDYGPEGIRYKDWDNIKNVLSNTDHFPIFGRKGYGAHQEKYDHLIGYAHDWMFFEPGVLDKDGHVHAEMELFDNIHGLSDLSDPNELPVSIGFIDLGQGRRQEIHKIKHLAMSLNKLEGDRCSTAGGMGCTASIKKSQGRDTIDPDTKQILKIKQKKQKEVIDMSEEEYEEEDMYEQGTEINHDSNAETRFKRICGDTGKSDEHCNEAWNAKKNGGAQAVKKGTQDPSKFNSKGDFEKEDSLEISVEEYADLLAGSKMWKENKDFIDKLKKAEEERQEKEANEIKDFLIEHVEEDFVEKFGKSLCDLKLMKGVVGNLKEIEQKDIKEKNNQRIMDMVGDKVEDFEKKEAEYKEEALKLFGLTK